MDDSRCLRWEGFSQSQPSLLLARLVLALVGLVLVGCSARPDRWQQFESGGLFSTAAPSMSPVDGSIVFASPRSGHGDIYLWRPGSAPPERLTDTPSVEASPLFSPDGRRIAFLREEGGYSHVFLMDLATKQETQLTFGAVMDEPRSFSADNNGLLITRRSAESGNSRQCVAINLADLSESIRVGDSACFSPDGTKIFFSEIDRKSRLSFVWFVDRRGQGKTPVCDGELRAVLPDGGTFLLTLNKGTEWAVCEPGRRWRQLVPLGEFTIFAIGTDGKQIVFTRESGARLASCDVVSGRIQPIDPPPGTITAIRACKGGFLLVATEPRDRLGDVYFLDGQSWKTRKLFSLNDEPGHSGAKP